MAETIGEGAAQAAPFFNPEAAFNACVAGLREFLDATFGEREHHVVLGLSGGIDSALVAVMAVEALGAGNVHAVTMPGPFTTQGTLDDAYRLAENLDIRLDEVRVEGAYEACCDAIEDGCLEDVHGTIAGQNIQARLRMIVLMALSNAYGWIVLNTGNLSEACMGYCTLYGDTVGAYSPIGGLLKTQVYAIANWVNERTRAVAGEVLIPEGIITRAPSAELADGQTDEESLGITYAVLDNILAHNLGGVSPEKIVEAGIATEEQVASVMSRMRANAFKAAWLPPHPSIAPVCRPAQ